MLQCYNRGCGQKYKPEENKEGVCRYHPGDPFFHDAYKGWSCCKKKTVDFTEFLNTKGCRTGEHSNIKPPEPEKPKETCNIEEIMEKAKKPPEPTEIERPPFETNLVLIKPNVVQSVKDAIDSLKPHVAKKEDTFGGIGIGTVCKNSGCDCTYESPASEYTECQCHPGVPIFHEGMKFWSCCQKRTTDFTSFMKQPGCTFGKHKWIDDSKNKKEVVCRYDWHQTPSTVVVAVYAKMYHYEKSSIKVNPIRLQVSLVFPEQDDATFELDVELRGIVKPTETKVRMAGTKVEITMQKADATSWSKLEFPRQKVVENKLQQNDIETENGEQRDGSPDVDLDDVGLVDGMRVANLVEIN